MTAPIHIVDIDAIRSSSRTIVRELGFMKHKLAGSSLSASAVHAILEIGYGKVDNATALAALLGLEKSTISRLVQGLEAKGLIHIDVDVSDARIHRFRLAEAGWRQFQDIEDYARRQVGSALHDMALETRTSILRGLSAYAAALQRRNGTGDGCRLQRSKAKICRGYVPGLLGRVTAMHADYYAKNHSFGSVFECKVASEMAEFLGRSDRPMNAVFSAESNGRLVGSVSIDGEDLGRDAAHLRWFIVDSQSRGTGIGKALISSAMDFVDQIGFSETRLWTFKGLDAARRLYEQAGFCLVQQKAGEQWGKQVHEQEFVRPKRNEIYAGGAELRSGNRT